MEKISAFILRVGLIGVHNELSSGLLLHAACEADDVVVLCVLGVIVDIVDEVGFFVSF